MKTTLFLVLTVLTGWSYGQLKGDKIASLKLTKDDKEIKSLYTSKSNGINDIVVENYKYHFPYELILGESKRSLNLIKFIGERGIVAFPFW